MFFNQKKILFSILLLAFIFLSQPWAYINYSLEKPFSGLAGNSVVEIVYDGVNIWVGTGKGLSYTPDGGITWLTFDHTNGLNQDGLSAIAYNSKDSTLWVATSYTQNIEGMSVPFGSGFNKITKANGDWDLDSLFPEQASKVGKLAYDIAISDTTVWAACFYGGLIRSKDNGLNWENVFVDSIAKADYEDSVYEDYRNRFFSVVADTVKVDNSVVDIVYDGVNIWAGTGQGLRRSSDGGLTWEIFDTTNGLNKKGVSALAFKDSTLWVATSCTQMTDGIPIPVGAGFNTTTNQGLYWNSFTPEQANRVGKLAYDIAIVDSTIWAACFYGGLIRSKDNGLNWENVFVDSIAKADYDSGIYKDYRNRFFSVVADTFNSDTTFIWAGTAAGIFKFVYTTSDTADTVIGYQQNDTLSSISGNFVISLGVQKYGDKKIIWAGTQPTYYGFYAASYTTDGGANWSTTLEGDIIWNFDFKDSVVWAATSSGLKKSIDFGLTWEVKNFMLDENRPDQQILNPEFYAVRVVGDTIWAGNFDGLVKSTDGGNSWKVFRTAVPVIKSYAFPNPFSPLLGNRAVRIRYKPESDGYVSIKIYDFEMKLVKTIENVEKTGGEEYDAIWDGTNEKGEIVANGIYFFKIKGPGGEEEWGKIGVIK